MNEIIALSLGPQRFQMLLGAFAALLLLPALIYGSFPYLVSQRTQELESVPSAHKSAMFSLILKPGNEKDAFSASHRAQRLGLTRLIPHPYGVSPTDPLPSSASASTTTALPA